MKQYKEILSSILTEGTWKDNRTGIPSIALPYPSVFRHDMRTGFPIPTARRAPFKSAAGEFCGFIRGVTSAADFRALGCKYWDQNANENAAWLANPFRKGEDDLGDVYGAQWRRWPGWKLLQDPTQDVINKIEAEGWVYRGQVGENTSRDADDFKSDGFLWTKEIDQLGDCIRTIINDPGNRRILFHAWNPAKLDELALPACHLLYQFMPNSVTKELGLSLTIRSNDLPIGFPSNCIEAALLLEFVAHITGYKPSWLTIVSNDAHIYKTAIPMVEEYLALPEFPLPTLEISVRVPSFDEFTIAESMMAHEPTYLSTVADNVVSWLDFVEPTDFKLIGYQHGPTLSAPMAV